MQTEHSPFPSDETLAAYIDGRLDEETRKRVVEHMAECPECFDVVMEGREAAQLEAELELTPFHGSRARARIALGLAAALSIVVYAAVLLHSKRDTYRSQLAEAMPAYRTVEGRLSGLPYRRMHPATRGKTEAPSHNPENWKLYDVAGRIYDSAKREPSVDNLHALGVSHLLIGNVADATTVLEDAIRKQTHASKLADAIAKSRDYGLIGDLGVALAENGRVAGKAEDQVLAAECAQRAWQLSQSPETAWNRAITLEALHLGNAAAAAWHDYLHLDASSEWAHEAKSHLERLNNRSLKDPQAVIPIAEQAVQSGDARRVRALAVEAPQQLRVYVQDKLFARWAEAITTGHTQDACRVLDAIAAIGQQQAATSGDFLITDSVHEIERARDDSVLLASLVTAHTAYGRAREEYISKQYDAAESFLLRADAAFAHTVSPFRHWVSIYESSTSFYKNDYRRAAANIRPARERMCASGRYASACATAQWIEGLAEAELGLPSDGVARFTSAINTFLKIGEDQNGAAVMQLRAELRTYMAEDEIAWSDRLRSVELNDTAGRSTRDVIWLELAKGCMRMGCTRVAGTVFSDVAARARTAGDCGTAADALSWRALTALADANFVQAQKDVDSATHLLAKVTDLRIRSRGEALLHSVQGDLLRAKPDTARSSIPELTRALNAYIATDNRIVLIDAYLARARARLAVADRTGADEDLAAGIEEFERQRDLFDDMYARSSFLDKGRQLYEEAIWVRISSGAFVDALVLEERSRFRSLPVELRLHPDIRPDRNNIGAMQAMLPPDTAIVEQRIIYDRLVTWVVSRKSIAYAVMPIHVAAVTSEIARLQQDLQNDAPLEQAQRDGVALHRRLLAPTAAYVRSFANLVFAPDAVLRATPFAALGDGGAFLVELHSVAVTQSAGFYAFRGHGGETNLTPTLLAVVPPRDLSTSSPPLYATRREIAAIMGCYSTRLLLSDQQATIGQFMTAVSSADVVHFAGHAVGGINAADDAIVLRSPNGNREDLLTASDVAHLHMKHASIVVLAACGTVSYHDSRVGGIHNLATAFLIAGADSVLGSSVQVGDEIAADLAVDFHRAYAHLRNPVSALRQAQRSRLRAPNTGASCLSFQLMT